MAITKSIFLRHAVRRPAPALIRCSTNLTWAHSRILVSNEQHVEDTARALAIGSESYSRRPSSSSWWTFGSLVATVAVATQVQGSNTAESCGICGVVGTRDHDARYVNN